MESDETSERQGIPVRLDWRNADVTPALLANQFAITVGLPEGPARKPEGIYLTVGHVSVPTLVGTPEEISEQVRGIGSVAIQVHGKFFLTRERLTELIDLLDKTAEQFDQAAAASNDKEGS